MTTREKFTLTFEFTDTDGTLDVKTASIEQDCCTGEDLFMWIADAFMAVGHLSFARQLHEAIKQKPTSKEG